MEHWAEWRIIYHFDRKKEKGYNVFGVISSNDDYSPIEVLLRREYYNPM